jgi:hypothetical protein
VLILVWIYYASLVFLFGAEFTEVYAHRHGSRAPEPAAERRTTAEGHSHTGLGPALCARATAISASVSWMLPRPGTLASHCGGLKMPLYTAVFAVVVGLLVTRDAEPGTAVACAHVCLRTRCRMGQARRPMPPGHVLMRRPRLSPCRSATL